VKLSKVPHLAAKKPVVLPPTHEVRLIYFKKFENPFTTRRLEAFDFEKGALKVDVVVRLYNMQQGITKSMHRGRRGPKPYSQTNKLKQAPAPKGSTPNGAKDRSRKVPQQGQGDRPTSASRPPTANTWSSNRPSTTPSTHPAHQSKSWAKVATASVH
jgi:hypothetical protein